MNELLQLIGATALFFTVIILMASVVVWAFISSNGEPDESSASVRREYTRRLEEEIKRGDFNNKINNKTKKK